MNPGAIALTHMREEANSSAIVRASDRYLPCSPGNAHPKGAPRNAAPEAMLAIAPRRLAGTYGCGSGQLMIGTELILFFGLPSMTRSL